MNVTREVILDLFPVYLSGEASPATRALVEDYLKQDTELALRLRLQWAGNFASAVPSAIPPELELRSLRRARKLLRLQSWLLGFGIGLTLTALSTTFSFQGRRLKDIRLLLLDYPAQLGIFLLLGIFCLAGYFLIRRRLRTAP